MTHNKFWLVCRYNEQNTVMIEGVFNNFQGAKELSDFLARTQGYNEFYICESTHHFKADVGVIETSFEATPEESLEVEHKFKIGDKVNHAEYGIGWIYECNNGLKYTVSKFEDFENACKFFAMEDELTLAQSETPTDFDKRCTPKRDFKVGDRVKLKDDDWDTGVILKIDTKYHAFTKWEKSSGEYWYRLCDIVHA